MNLDFDKIWASDTSPDYPTDTQTKRGLSYLGTEPPTFDLHDAIFQRLDKKDQWLYDQVRLTCERFGQNVSESVAGASRDTMANAITNALLTQRKADEGGYGIVRMANYEQAQAGKEYNLAVSPAHLKECMDSHSTWENTKDKPQTATRWPYYSEVKNTPSLGTASSKDVEYFEKNGEAAKAVENRVIRDGITIAGVRSDDGSFSPYVRKDSGEVVNLATESTLLTLNAGLSRIAKTGNVADSTGNIPWDRVGDKPRWTNNVYAGDGDTVVTSSSGTGRLSVNDEWINFYPSQKGSCFSVGPDGRIYNSLINHDQVMGLGSAALTPTTDYERSGSVSGLRNSLSEIAFTGAWSSLSNQPDWVPRVYAGSSNSATGLLSQSGKSRIEVTDGSLNFYPQSGEASKFGVDSSGLLSNCMINLSSIINSDSLATKAGAGQLIVTKENNGYIRFENGTILQFATGDFGVSETAMWVNFPAPFPNACLWAGVSTRLLSDNNDTNTWFQMVSWDSYTAKVYRQIVNSETNKQQTAPYIFAIGR